MNEDAKLTEDQVTGYLMLLEEAQKSKAQSAGEVVSEALVSTARDVKHGAIYLAKGAKGGAGEVKGIVGDFFKGLKKGWEKA